MDKPTGKRGTGYLRVSDGEKQSVESQRQQIEAWLSARCLSVQEWYIDSEGRNSRHKADKREDFQRLLQDIAASRWDWVVVNTQDRFGTKHEFERGKFLNALLDAGCELWSVDHGHLTDPDNPVCVLIGGIGSLTSRKDTKDKARKILGGMLTAAREGRYTGGNVPFGFDVAIYPVGRWEPESERWRVVIEGRGLRVKVWPDGRRERYDGKRNFPAYDRTLEARFAVSIVTERVEAARQVFTWYATEDIAFWTIAQRLNLAGVKPMSGKSWTARMVEDMLANPSYVGIVASGKDSQGDFATHRMTTAGPEVIETPWVKNQASPEGRRGADQWVIPDTFRLPPIVAQTTWERVQEKLERPTREKKRTARSEVCWLKRFMVCAHCEQGMRSINNQSGRAGTQYFCSTWQDSKQGRDNRAGCRRHPVDHDLAERIVARYLEEKQVGYELLDREIGQPGRRIERLAGELEARRAEIQEIHQRMLAFVQQAMSNNPSPLLRELFEAAQRRQESETPWEPSPRDVQYRFGLSWLVDLYETAHGHLQGDLADQIERAERDLKAQVLAFAKLKSPRAQEIAAKHIEQLEAQLEEMKQKQEPLMARLESLHRELAKVKFFLDVARKELTGSNHRRKAEALGKVVQSIVCRFRHQEGGGRTPTSVLESVQIIPVGGEPTTYPAGLFEEGDGRSSAHTELKQGQGLMEALMGRTYRAEEIDSLRTG